MARRRIVFLTGAGISAESGLSTFRGKDGLWTDEEAMYLFSTDALRNDLEKALNFYNIMRRQVAEAQPNAAHRLIAELERTHEVLVVTQNIDDLHERAGSTRVVHLHGEFSKVCSSANRQDLRYVEKLPFDVPLRVSDKAGDGTQLRPYVVMFGEAVDGMEEAIAAIGSADVFVVVGTSLQVYPAAGLIHYAPETARKFVIDPGRMEQCAELGFMHFQSSATEGMQAFIEALGE